MGRAVEQLTIAEVTDPGELDAVRYDGPTFIDPEHDSGRRLGPVDYGRVDDHVPEASLTVPEYEARAVTGQIPVTQRRPTEREVDAQRAERNGEEEPE